MCICKIIILIGVPIATLWRISKIDYPKLSTVKLMLLLNVMHFYNRNGDGHWVFKYVVLVQEIENEKSLWYQNYLKSIGKDMIFLAKEGGTNSLLANRASVVTRRWTFTFCWGGESSSFRKLELVNPVIMRHSKFMFPPAVGVTSQWSQEPHSSTPESQQISDLKCYYNSKNIL